MQFVDLKTQFVRKFAKLLSLQFHPAYTVVFGNNESGKSTILDILLACLDQNYLKQVAATFVPWAAQGRSEALLTLKEKDGHVYRLRRDFLGGKIVFASYMEMTKQFETIAEEPRAFEELLTTRIGFPTLDVFRRFYVTALEDLPSARATSAPLGGAADGGAFSVFDESEGDEEAPRRKGPTSKEELEARLEEVREELKMAEEIDGLQFRLDGLHRQRDELDAASNKIRENDRELENQRDILVRMASLKGITPEIEKKINNYKATKEQARKEVGDLEDKHRVAEDEFKKLQGAPPFFKTPLFLGGAGLACCFILAIVIHRGFVGLPGFVGLGLMGFAFFKDTQFRAVIGRKQAEVSELSARMSNTRKNFEIELERIEGLMKATGVTSAEEVREKIEKFRLAQKKVDEVQAKRQTLVAEMSLETATAKRKELTAEIDDCVAKQRKFSGVSMDPNTMKREIKRLERQLSKMGVATAAPEESESAPLAGASASPARPSHAGVDFEGLLACGKKLSGFEEGEFLTRVNAKFKSYLAVFTSQNYPGGKMEPSGACYVVSRVGAREIPFADLSPATKDAVYFSLKFALYETVAAQLQVPIIFDDPFLHFDDQRLVAVAKGLKHLSKFSQVIHLTSRQAHTKLADHSINLNSL